ncbi:glycosyltransferase [Vibrio breoganii]
MTNFRVKYIFNCTTNNVGGAIQNSVNFIKYTLIGDDKEQWFFLLSEQVYVEVKDCLPKGKFKVFKSPSKSFTARKKIKEFVSSISPDIVYTSAGPAYVKFDCTHIMGCSNPYILGAPKVLFKNKFTLISSLLRKIHTFYQKKHIMLADYWILQTDISKSAFTDLGLPSERCFVVHNAVSEKFVDHFKNNSNFNSASITNKKRINVLFPSAYYNHKNFEILPALIKKLQSFGVDAHFTITVGCHKSVEHVLEDAKRLGVQDKLTNIGSFLHEDAIKLYLSHDIIFQPSLLEVFSTSYIEAMAVKKPLIVCDLPFAKDTCKDYAYYFIADDVSCCAKLFLEVITSDPKLPSRHHQAKVLLEHYGDQNFRYNKLQNLINGLVGK